MADPEQSPLIEPETCGSAGAIFKLSPDPAIQTSVSGSLCTTTGPPPDCQAEEPVPHEAETTPTTSEATPPVDPTQQVMEPVDEVKTVPTSHETTPTTSEATPPVDPTQQAIPVIGDEAETTPTTPEATPPVDQVMEPEDEVHAKTTPTVSEATPPVDHTQQTMELIPADRDDEVHTKTTPMSSETTPTTPPADPTPAPVPQPVFQDDWSKLSRDIIIDKIKGIIYGQAIGDALGLATEFMSRKEAVRYYGKSGPTAYSDIIQDFHRSRWLKGDWTDDTDQLLLILQMIVERKGSVDKCAFAAKMRHWRQNGFTELKDVGGMGIGMTVSQTLSHHRFLDDPHEAAKEVWERSGRYLAANGAIMRTAILGVLEFNDLERVVANTREVCLATHADPRCLASCIAVTTAIALMLQGVYDTSKKKELDALVTAAIKKAQKALEHSDQKEELVTHVKASKLKELELEDRRSMGYTFKALGAGFYGLRHATKFRDMLQKVIMEAGDADSNGAVCGALMGCKFGFRGLPQDLLSFPYREWLDRQVAQFLKEIGLQEST